MTLILSLLAFFALFSGCENTRDKKQPVGQETFDISDDRNVSPDELGGGMFEVRLLKSSEDDRAIVLEISGKGIEENTVITLTDGDLKPVDLEKPDFRDSAFYLVLPEDIGTGTYSINYLNEDGTTGSSTILIKGLKGKDGEPGPPGPEGPPGPQGENGASAHWLGVLSEAPEQANPNDMYFDIGQGVSYINDGTAWVKMSPTEDERIKGLYEDVVDSIVFLWVADNRGGVGVLTGVFIAADLIVTAHHGFAMLDPGSGTYPVGLAIEDRNGHIYGRVEQSDLLDEKFPELDRNQPLQICYDQSIRDLVYLRIDQEDNPFSGHWLAPTIVSGDPLRFQPLIHVGNPEGFTFYWSEGSVERIGKTSEISTFACDHPGNISCLLHLAPDTVVLLHDAQTTFGSSGGALIDREGSLIGIVSAGATTIGAFFNYAVSAEYIAQFLDNEPNQEHHWTALKEIINENQVWADFFESIDEADVEVLYDLVLDRKLTQQARLVHSYTDSNGSEVSVEIATLHQVGKPTTSEGFLYLFADATDRIVLSLEQPNAGTRCLWLRDSDDDALADRIAVDLDCDNWITYEETDRLFNDVYDSDLPLFEIGVEDDLIILASGTTIEIASEDVLIGISGKSFGLPSHYHYYLDNDGDFIEDILYMVEYDYFTAKLQECRVYYDDDGDLWADSFGIDLNCDRVVD